MLSSALRAAILAAHRNTDPKELKQRRERLRAELARQDVSWCFYGGFLERAAAYGSRQQFVHAGLVPPHVVWPDSGKSTVYWDDGVLRYELRFAHAYKTKKLGRDGEQWQIQSWRTDITVEDRQKRLSAQKLRDAAEILNPKRANKALLSAASLALQDKVFQQFLARLVALTMPRRGRIAGRKTMKNTQEHA